LTVASAGFPGFDLEPVKLFKPFPFSIAAESSIECQTNLENTTHWPNGSARFSITTIGLDNEKRSRSSWAEGEIGPEHEPTAKRSNTTHTFID
jgi:hypothetical protein